MQSFNPDIELLERRRHFSISMVHRILSVQGAANEPNAIVVGLAPGGASVVASLTYPTRKGMYSKSVTYPLTDNFRFVSINGGNKSDSITIDQTNGTLPLLVRINTRSGNDTVTGGDEPDIIHAGNGIDQINSGDGNDTIYGGRGPDTLVGGNGNDVIHAGQGGDDLVAGNGNTTFIDPFGHNTVLGGTGNDTFVLKNIHLDPDNNFTVGKDTFKQWTPPSNGSTWYNNPSLDGLLGSLLYSYI